MSAVVHPVQATIPQQAGVSLRLLTCGACAAVLILAWMVSLPFSFWPPLAGSLALLVVGFALRRRYRPFALWLTLALVAQAAALHLIDAGPTVRYQHYRLFGPLRQTQTVLVLVLLLQTALVTVALFRRRSPLWGWVRSHLRAWQVVCLALLFLLTSATLSRQPAVYVGELGLAGAIQAVHLGNLFLAVASLPEEGLQVGERLSAWLLGEDSTHVAGYGLDRFSLLAAGSVTVTAAILCSAIYHCHPHIPDEVAYLLHARYFADGKLTMPLPAVVEGFDVDLMQYENTFWYCPVPPGWPAVLAVGAFFGVPWLVNPILAGVNVLLAYLLLQRLYDRPTARLATLLLCVSPWYLFLAMSYMTHTLTLTCALTATLAVLRARETGRMSWAALGGAGIGAASLIRPLEGLALALLLGIWTLRPGAVGRRWLSLATLVAATVLVGGLVLPYNHALTGSPTSMPIQVYTDRIYGPGSNALGFGPNRGLGWTGLDPLPGHGFFDVLINANFNLFATNIELFGWATGSLLLIGLAVLLGAYRRSDALMLAVIGMIIGIHSFYYFSGGPDFGARYWFLIIIPCVALAARGIQLLGERCAFFPGGIPHGRTRVLVGVTCLCGLTLMTFIPWRALDKYRNYRGMRADIRELDRQHHFGRSLVLIRGARHPDYASAVIYNPLDLNADAPIYAWDRDATTRARLLRAYPDRPVWVINGPTITGEGFQLVEGPLPPGQ